MAGTLVVSFCSFGEWLELRSCRFKLLFWCVAGVLALLFWRTWCSGFDVVFFCVDGAPVLLFYCFCVWPVLSFDRFCMLWCCVLVCGWCSKNILFKDLLFVIFDISEQI